jgi:hypothetical protein
MQRADPVRGIPYRRTSRQKEFGMLVGRHHFAALFLTPILFCGSFSAMAVDRPVDVTPAANVDENLFVLRAFAREFNRWPQDPWDGKAALKFCEESRLQVKFLRSIAVSHRLDDGIRGMCDDFTMLIDEYESSLAEIGKIDDKARSKAIEDALNTFVVGAAKSLEAGAKADRQGKSELEVDGAVAKSLVDDGLKVYIEHSKARDAQTNNSVAAEQDRFDKVLTFAQERNRAATQGLADRNHWAAGEAGFDFTPATPLEDVARRRPRDPFAKLNLAAAGIDDKTTADGFIDRARLCIEAARLVPAGDAFDSYRIECLTRATECSCNAAELGIGATYRDAPTPYAQEAIDITQAMSKADAEDRNGWVHVELFRALSAAGRFDEAIEAAKPLMDSHWNQSLAFGIRYMRVMGVTGHADQLEQWLRACYKMGYSDLKFVKESGDFDCLRTQKPDAYAELTTVKGSTYIYYGLVHDDVIVKNRSPFPMTNLKMKFTVIKGGQIWKEDRTLPFVAADSEETLSDVFMIPDSRYDQYRWSLESDQGKLSSEKD